MRSFFLVSFLTKASGNNAPGAFFSISESSLNAAWNDVTGDIVNGLRAFKIPGHKDPLVQIDDLQFESFTIGSASVTVNDGEGVEVSLKDMSNAVAHTHFCRTSGEVLR